MILDRVARNEESLGDCARVESGDDGRDDISLALRERVAAAEDIECLGWSCASKRDSDLAVGVSLVWIRRLLEDEDGQEEAAEDDT